MSPILQLLRITRRSNLDSVVLNSQQHSLFICQRTLEALNLLTVIRLCIEMFVRFYFVWFCGCNYEIENSSCIARLFS